jgi:membrane associated rhomboid family serine protease
MCLNFSTVWNTLNDPNKTENRAMIKKQLQMPFLLVAVMCAVFIFEVILPGNLSWLGIRPRSITGLIGIPFAPFLHANLSHLSANAIPLAVMAVMVNVLNPGKFISRTILLIIGSGFFTWAISSSGIVIGASGLVFAYWAYLIVNGIRTQRIKDIVMALITIIVYGTLLFSLFQHTAGVSWAGHFSGALAGGLLAWKGSRSR